MFRVQDEFLGRTIFCPTCGGQVAVAAPLGGMPAKGAISVENVRYAGFWIRFVAALIDMVVLAIPVMFAGAFVPFFGSWAVSIMYKGYLIANWNGQTIGKRACGIRVVNAEFGPCSLGRAVGRTAAEFLSSIILCIGYLMAGFDSRKQSLHDKVAETFHIYAE
ncbi:MAG: hypothetical protein DHS20C16_25430 [Phycisphaerae bacterium]|nr:MAG: hypothetical protein DHS20C16_25430 [Phycisphaerae bacterium]